MSAQDAGFGPSAVCEYKYVTACGVWRMRSLVWGAFMRLGCVRARRRYVDLKRLTFEFEAMCSSIMAAPNGSVFFLHACAHNPTGTSRSAVGGRVRARVNAGWSVV
jgi:hypothetical protein